MRRLNAVLPLVLASSVYAQSLPGDVSYVNSRQLVLSFRTANSTEIQRVRVWILADQGASWREATATRHGAGTVGLEVEQDGKFYLFMTLENESGRSSDPPTARTEPHAAIVIDTAPPTLQLHKVRQVASADGDRLLQLNVSLVEENLGQSGSRMFYRRSEGGDGWSDGGVVTFCDGIVHWSPPTDAASPLDLRLVVTDLAGNRAVDEVCGVELTPAPANATDPSDSDAAEVPSVTAEHAGAVPLVTVPPVEPVTVDVVALDGPPEAVPASQPAFRRDARAQRLRALAARYEGEGQVSLAGARLQDALEIAPDDPDLQVDLGSLFYRTRQYDDAVARFRAALEESPDHIGAIDGLALVAATQNRYSEARSHLQHLLRLDPNSSKHWLHYGDMEHYLGNATEAFAAWNKALSLEPVDEAVRKDAQKRLRLFGGQPDAAK